MAKAIIDEQNLTDIADAIRAKNGSADTYTPSEMATAIGDLPTPTPVTKGLVFSDYDADGYPTKAEFVGSWTTIPQNFLRQIGAGNLQILYKITHLDIPEGVTRLRDYSFYGTVFLKTITLPSTLTTIDSNAFYGAGLTSIEIPSGVTAIPVSCFNVAQSIKQVVMKGDITSIGLSAFRSTTACELFDFSNCSAVPTVNANSFTSHKSGCVIKVPSALLSTWQTTGNWASLTDVVWQGV